MRIIYDETLKVAGIGIVPWARLGPEQWFSNYRIASFYDWDLISSNDLPPVYSLDGRAKLQKLSTAQLIQNSNFQKLLASNLKDYAFLTYKPIIAPKILDNSRFLANSPDFIERFENKYWFRQHFQKTLDFPPYRFFELKELEASEKFFAQLIAGRQAVVLQDEKLSGAKGTFIITNFEQYVSALKRLSRLPGNRKIIISENIQNGRERSVQACVTKFGVFVGPLQRQIIANPLLVGTKPGAEKFAGVSIVKDDQETQTHQEAIAVAQKIGEQLQSEGYRGIFGVNFLLDVNNKLYVLEDQPSFNRCNSTFNRA